MTPHGVELGVAGFCTVSEDRLRKAIGRAPFEVWQVLCRYRNRQGFTFVSQETIAREVAGRPSYDRVKRALKRLKVCGLVQIVGWKEKNSVMRSCTEEREVFFRRVLGARVALEKGPDRVRVPDFTKEWVMRKKEHRGGPRVRLAGGQKVESKNRPTPSKTAQPPQSKNRPRSSLTLSKSTAFKGCDGFILKNETHAPPNVVGAADVPSFGSETELGSSFGGGTKPHLVKVAHRERAKLPSITWSVITPAMTPPPSKLQESDPEEFRVRLLAQSFRSAVESEYGGRCFLLARVSPRSRSYAVLAKAAKRLQDYSVAPAAWCLWAVRRWRRARMHEPGYVEGQAVPLPPVHVIFSVKHIDDRCADPDDRFVVEECLPGRRVIYGKTHKALLTQYAKAQTAVMQGCTADEALTKFFPGTSFDDMVEAARAEAKEIRYNMEHDALRGKVIY